MSNDLYGTNPVRKKWPYLDIIFHERRDCWVLEINTIDDFVYPSTNVLCTLENMALPPKPLKPLVRARGRMFWGGMWWGVIHVSAKTYEPEKKQAFLTLFDLIPQLLPCEACGRHFIEELKVEPLAELLAKNPTAEEVYLWSERLHTRVNAHRPFMPSYQFDIPSLSAYWGESISEPVTAASANGPPAPACLRCARRWVNGQLV